MATRTLTLKNVPETLVSAIVDLALIEDRTPSAQAERLLREALTAHGYWPPARINAREAIEGRCSPVLTTDSREPEAVA